MALRTASVTGDWTNTATWGGAAVPGIGDTFAINAGVIVSVTTAVTVGTSPAAGTDIGTITKAGCLKVNGGTFLCRGDVGLAGASSPIWDAIWLLNGGVFKFDSTAAGAPTTTHYRVHCTAAFTYARIRADGVLGTRCLFSSVGVGSTGAEGSFDLNNSGANVVTGAFQCDYTDFSDLGTSTIPMVYGSGNTTQLHFDHCLFDRCGLFRVEEVVTPDVEFTFTNSRLRNSLDTAFGNGMRVFFTASPTATRSLNGSVFESASGGAAVRPNFNNCDGLTMDNTFFENAVTAAYGVKPTTAPVGMVVGYQGDTQTFYNDPISVLFYNQSEANPHYIAFPPDGDYTIDGNVIEQTGGTQYDGDFIQSTTNSVAKTLTITSNIKLPDATGGSSGNLINAGATNQNYRIEHNTIHLGGGCTDPSGAIGGVFFGEHPNEHTGMFTGIRSNLCWDTNPAGGYNLVNAGTKDVVAGRNTLGTVADVVTQALMDYNARFNVQTTGTSTVNGVAGTSTPGYQNFIFSAAGLPGVHDVVGVDPLFVDPTRGIAKFDWSLAATISTAITLTSATVTVGGASIRLATATLTAHGLSHGDWVTIAGASSAAYNGTFRVRETTTNTFTYLVTGTPGADSATLTKKGSVANWIAQMKLRNDPAWDSRYTQSATMTYIKAGFVPTAAAMVAAHDGVNGGTIGALPYAAGGGTAALAYTTQPGGAVSGGLLSPQPVLAWQVGGVTQTGITTPATLTLVGPVSGGPGTLSGTTTKAAVAGVIAFTDLRVTGAGVDYQLSAS